MMDLEWIETVLNEDPIEPEQLVAVIGALAVTLSDLYQLISAPDVELFKHTAVGIKFSFMDDDTFIPVDADEDVKRALLKNAYTQSEKMYASCSKLLAYAAEKHDELVRADCLDAAEAAPAAPVVTEVAGVAATTT